MGCLFYKVLLKNALSKRKDVFKKWAFFMKHPVFVNSILERMTNCLTLAISFHLHYYITTNCQSHIHPQQYSIHLYTAYCRPPPTDMFQAGQSGYTIHSTQPLRPWHSAGERLGTGRGQKYKFTIVDVCAELGRQRIQRYKICKY